jgi:subtilisin family serine protease
LTAALSRRAELHFNRRIYSAEDSILVNVKINQGSIQLNEYLKVYILSPDSKDIEVVSLKRSNGDNTFTAEKPLPINQAAQNGKAQPLNGELTLRPNEKAVALFFVPKEEGKDEFKEVIADFALLEDKNFKGSQSKIMPELAMTEDEKIIPEGGKRIGTIATEKSLPVQIPLNELIICPADHQQLEQFLKETEGKVIMDDVIDDQEGGKAACYLIGLEDTSQADIVHLPQIRALFGENDTLYASSEDALRMYALAMEYWMRGYAVGVNSRLQYMAAPTTSDAALTTGVPFDAMGTDPNHSSRIFADPDNRLQVRNAWAFLALWDKDTERIPVAFLDMGFAPNPDFRGFPENIFQRDLEGGTTGPHSAEATPSVGASFFGPPMWHGNGVVTTAGGVLNNGFGAVGTGGQVLEPRLYKTGLRSYVFEIGRGIIQATNEGAAIINISAGYPCRVVSNIGVGFRICSQVGRVALCATLRTILEVAADLLLLIPIVGPGLRLAAQASIDTAFAACLLIAVAVDVLGGELRGPMERAVQYAQSRGVPVVSIAGNIPRNLPRELGNIIPLDEQDVSIWEVVPGVIPGVICVGACDDGPSFANIHYFGDRVDIWAPIREGGPHLSFFKPHTIEALGTPQNQIPLEGFGGTSAAAPYVTGIIAMMMAVNRTLNPVVAQSSGLTTGELALIPGRIRQLLIDNATPRSSLPQDPSNPNFARRRNLVNAFRSVRAAARGTNIIDFEALNYDSSLGLTDPVNVDAAHAMSFNALDESAEISKTILTIPAGPGPNSPPSLTYTTEHWYAWRTPRNPGIYGGRIRLTFPDARQFDELSLTIDGREVSAATTTTTADREEIREYDIPPTFHEQEVPIIVRGFLLRDNIYKIKFLRGQLIREIPQPDRFDRPEINPPERPNNNSWEQAVPLGTGEFMWREFSLPNNALGLLREFQIVVPDLNFHQANDEDWFIISPPPEIQGSTDQDCPPYLEITAGRGAIIELYGLDHDRPIRSGRSFVRLDSTRFRFPVRARIRYTGGASIDYNLRITWITNISSIFCRLAELLEIHRDEIIEWVCLPCGMEFFNPLDDYFKFTEKPDSKEIVTQPQFYFINWQVTRHFVLEAQVRKGDSLALQLLSPKGEVLSQATTSDLLKEFGKAKMPIESSSISRLHLTFSELPIGYYILSVSHGLPNTPFQLTLKTSDFTR